MSTGAVLEFTPTKDNQTPADQDHSACGVGFVAAENGVASNQILRYGKEGVANMEHRGGSAADAVLNGDFKVTTDGVGFTIQVDQDYWKQKFVRRFGEGRLIDDQGRYTELGNRDLAVGTVFMPRDNRENFNECRRIFEEEFKKEGYEISEREAPMEDEVLGVLARKTHPRIFQYCVLQKDGVTKEKFDADIYRIRRKIEKRIHSEKLSGQGQNRFYIPSLSRHIVTFKGLALAHNLEDLYTDLKYNDKLVIHGKNGEVVQDNNYKTAFAIFHRRYATNTSPTWERAHPYHSGVAHNGEINSLVTNVEMFKQRLENVFIQLYGAEHKEILKDVINEDGTDSAQFADVIDFLVHCGFSAHAIKCLLVPEAVMPGSEMSEDVRSMCQFIDAFSNPWDGPSTVIMVDRDQVLIGGDRSGFRPIRIVRTKDGIIYGASEDGILHTFPNKDVVERPPIQPGQMLAVNFKEGRVIEDKELKERAAKELEETFGYKALLKNIVHLEEIPAGERDYDWSNEESEQELARRQRLGVYSQETVEYLDTMAATGKEPLGSMGDDAALTITSPVYRTVQNFVQQKFAQVTNPPLDTIREKVVTSLKTYIGFFFDKDGKKTKKKVYGLNNPILNNAEFQAMRKELGRPNTHEFDCTFDEAGDSDQLRTRLDMICDEAAALARHGKHIILTDEHIGEDRVAIPMVLVVGAVNTHLAKLGLRGQTTINVRSAEAHEAHDFAALIGLAGADTVNAYMAEETIAARHKLGIYHFEDETSAYHSGTSLKEFLELYAGTGDPALDEQKKALLLEKLETPGMAAFVSANGELSLEALAKHSDASVRRMFGSFMKDLDVTVHDVFGKQSLEHVVGNWKKAAQNGLLKIMGKMGISHVSSYRGGRLFEALGLSQEVIDLCFPGISSPMKGLSVAQIQERAVAYHRKVYATKADAPLENKGRYKLRNGNDTEPHVMTAEQIELFQDAVKQGNFDDGYEIYKKYKEAIYTRTQKYRFQVRDWVDFKPGLKAIDISEVESHDDLIKRFYTGSMSRGSISKEAHETLAIAAARKGFVSSSGEGGEDPERYGTEKRSKSKQVASARFGVTRRYLRDADELQIKIAQGAKPGEGGELPGGKVTVEIAALRHCEPGTGLISPSTHHDIYSIEDLEQLIYDLKQINPRARINVKLVASTGVDVIASGCAKANADTIQVSGYNGGTGASPQGSIAHAGMPWELFINKVHRTLSEQGFRGRVKLGTDGGMRTGRDIVIAALLGAEEFGFGLQALIAEGCKLVRTCQNGKCPFKVAGDLGEFVGTPEMIMNMMDFIAEDVREILAGLGLKSLDEAIGRTDLLQQVYGQDLGIDLSDAIPDIDPNQIQQKCELKEGERNERINPKDPHGITLDKKILNEHAEKMMAAIQQGVRFETTFNITNEDRTFSAGISDYINNNLGENVELKEDTVVLNLKGVAGQSLGAALMEGVTINLEGASNDGVGKSLSGGKIVVYPDRESEIHAKSHENVIVGNATLYGATSGALYAAGLAAHRFAIRNSGATAVVEGAGYSACEYMTGGTVAILGEVGDNFGSGMSGGEVFVYDESNTLESRTYDEETKKKIKSVDDSGNRAKLKGMVSDHFKATGSLRSKALLQDWDTAVKKFKHIKGKAENVAPLPFYPAPEQLAA